jgi:hypothetical protein
MHDLIASGSMPFGHASSALHEADRIATRCQSDRNIAICETQCAPSLGNRAGTPITRDLQPSVKISSLTRLLCNRAKLNVDVVRYAAAQDACRSTPSQREVAQ